MYIVLITFRTCPCLYYITIKGEYCLFLYSFSLTKTKQCPPLQSGIIISVRGVNIICSNLTLCKCKGVNIICSNLTCFSHPVPSVLILITFRTCPCLYYITDVKIGDIACFFRFESGKYCLFLCSQNICKEGKYRLLTVTILSF